MTNVCILEYIWLDAHEKLRSKIKVVHHEVESTSDCPIWNFDGSSTGQSKGTFSDVFLKPVRLYNDPFRDCNSKLVLCECYDDHDGKTPNKFNHRKALAEIQEVHKDYECLSGIE